MRSNRGETVGGCEVWGEKVNEKEKVEMRRMCEEDCGVRRVSAQSGLRGKES